MKIEKKYLGKWVAAKNDKIIAADKTLTKLREKVGKKENMEQIKFALIPASFIAG
jgi:hypothetical protein